MKIELRRISHNARLSQETNAFAADVWIDGVKAGGAENAGHGGSTLVYPESLRVRLTEYGKTLPRVPYGHGMDGDFEQSADWIIDALLEDHLRTVGLERAVKRALGRRVLFTKKGKPGIYEIPLKPGRTIPQIIAAVQARGEADKILNELPLAEAVAIYSAAAEAV